MICQDQTGGEDKYSKKKNKLKNTIKCDYSDGYSLVTVDLVAGAEADTDATFKNFVPFSTWKTEINYLFVDKVGYICAYVQSD